MLLSTGSRSVRRPVWLHRRSLERRLAEGADPSLSPELARRAEQLRDRRLRRRLAADLEEVVEAVNAAPSPLSARAPVNRLAIHESRALLLGLAEDLRSDGPVSAQAVALVRRLLKDGGSPLYSPVEPKELQEAARRAREAV